MWTRSESFLSENPYPKKIKSVAICALSIIYNIYVNNFPKELFKMSESKLTDSQLPITQKHIECMDSTESFKH